MNGLLDFIKTPEGQGLLSAAFGGLAGARRGTPLNNIGRAGVAGLTGYGSAQDRITQESEAADQKIYKQAQLKKLEQDAASDAQRSAFFQSLLNPGSAAIGDGADVGDVGPTKTNAERMPTGPIGALSKLPKEAVQADIALNGGKNVAEWLFKAGMPDMVISNGYAVDKNNLRPGFIPGISTSNDGKSTMTTVGNNGLPVVSAPAGALETFSGYRSIEEDAKAGSDVMPITLPDGTTILTTRKAVVNATNPTGRAPAGAAPVKPSGSYSGPGYAGGSAEAASNDQRFILQRELEAATKQGRTADVAALNRELARLPGGAAPASVPPVPGIRVQSEAEKIGAATKAREDAALNSGEAGRKAKDRKDFAINSANTVIGVVDEASDLVGYSTAGLLSGLSGVRGSSAKDLAAKLETIKANLGFDRLQQMRDMSPTGGALGSVAVQELTALQSTVSSLDQGQSPPQLKASLAKIKKHYEKWRDAVVRSAGDGGATETWDEKPTRKVVKTGTYGGKKVIQYDDGSTEYAN